MPDNSLHTTQLHRCVDQFRAGDQKALNELLVAASARLEKLARRMLGGFPAVRAEVETGDVLQAALMRLIRSLTDVRPDSTRSFFNLAAVQMHRELLDLRTRQQSAAECRWRTMMMYPANWETKYPHRGIRTWNAGSICMRQSNDYPRSCGKFLD